MDDFEHSNRESAGPVFPIENAIVDLVSPSEDSSEGSNRGNSPMSLDAIATAADEENPNEETEDASGCSSPDPSRAIEEMSLRESDGSSTGVVATDPSEGPSDWDGTCSEEDGHDGRAVDRQNEQLRAMLADSTDDNSRQSMELEARRKELQQMKMELKKAKEENTVKEGYIKMAEEECGRLQEEKESLTRKLKECMSELDQLKQELKHRDEMQESLEKTGGWTELRAGGTEGSETESQSSENENGNPKAPEDRLIQMTFRQAMGMIKIVEDRCRNARLQNAVHLSMDQGETRAAIMSQIDEHLMMNNLSDASSGDSMSLDSESDYDPNITVELPENRGPQLLAHRRSPEGDLLPQLHGSQVGVQSNKRVSQDPEYSPHIVHPIPPNLNYSPTMDWTETETQWLSMSDPETGSNEGSAIAMRVRKRRRAQKNIEESGVDEAEIHFPVETIMPPSPGMLEIDVTNDGLGIALEHLSSEPQSTTIACLEEPCQTYEGQLDHREVFSDTEAAFLDEQEQTPKASRWTPPKPTNMVSNLTQTDPAYVLEPVLLKPTNMASKFTQTYPADVWESALPKTTNVISNFTQTDSANLSEPAKATRQSPGQDKTRKFAGVCKTQPKRHGRASRISSSMTAIKTQFPTDNGRQLMLGFRRSCRNMQKGWCVAGLALLGFILYCCWHREARAWMKANRIPHRVLLELRNGQVSESQWMQKLNYGLVTLLDIDRAALG